MESTLTTGDKNMKKKKTEEILKLLDKCYNEIQDTVIRLEIQRTVKELKENK